jgi:uncharacterized protein
MTVTELWRHPVKSLQGQALTTATVVSDGLEGDRVWGIRDLATERILTARREPALLDAGASVGGDGDLHITLPDGTALAGPGPATDAALSAWLGRTVSLVSSTEVPPAVAEFFSDATDDGSEPVEWTMPSGRFVDAMPVLLLTTAALRAGAALHPRGRWETRRFRPNVVVDVAGEGFVEDAWCHRPVRIGDAELLPRQGCVRCTMVTRPQPGLDRDVDLYKVLARHHGGTFGVWAEVVHPGTIALGDPVEIG